ncbi:MAG: sugar phosphate isomerase/epimerase family protein [Luteitalea sp.]
MYLAYTSFAVRMLQGRDILKSTAAALGPDTFRQLCMQFGASGGQIDHSQLPLQTPSALEAVRASFVQDGIELELSIPSRSLESPEAYAQAVAVARALGATRARVALLSGRRYEHFKTAAAWAAFTEKWRTTLLRMRPHVDRHRLDIGIENHKDWLAPELAALLRAVDSPHVGACVDFGNNLALLEDPDETIDVLAPFAVTTHLKDMAVRRTTDGFELSEVPLGRGLLPLERYTAAIRRARPDARLCLEMITRDPLNVPYRTDRFWVPFDEAARGAGRVREFEARVLSHSRAEPRPRITGLAPAAQLEAEDENVRVSVAYARDVLKLEAHRA